jgi:hypothetical protein
MFLTKIRKNLSSKYIWLILCQILIVYASLRNVFPNGYIFAGGDITQYYNLSHIVKGLGYTWSNLSGEGFFLQFFSYNLYYSVVYFFKSLFHISNSGQSFFYFFLFLSGSFWSFYLSSKVYFKELPKNDFYRIGFALLYTFNFYTINSFYFIWGYSPFLTLYALVPAIFGLSYKYFSSEKINWPILLLLSIPFFLSNIANGNMAFFIALNIFLFIFIVLMYFLSESKNNLLSYLKKTAMFYIFYLLYVCWSVLPQIVELLKMASNFKGGSGAIFDVRAWIIWQSIRFPDIFFLVPHLQDFIHTKIFLGAILFFIFIAMVIWGYATNRSETRNIGLIFLILLIVAIFLENKGVGLLSSGIILAFFNNPILGALRSNDKVFSILPYFIIILVFIQFRYKSYSKYLVALLVLLSVAFSFPFFTGGLQTKYSSAFADGGNYLTSQGSFIHIIPDEYYKAASLLNARLTDSKIFRTPFNALNSPGWVNFKWGVTGVDPTTQLFNSPAVEMNGYGAFGDWSYGQVWGRQSTSDSVWFMPLTGYLNTEYLIYHKDITQKFITATEEKITDYEKAGYITKISESSSFNLYKIADRFYLPHIYVPNQSIVSDKQVAQMPTILNGQDLSDRSAVFLTLQNQGKDLTSVPSNLKESPTIEYKKINPTKYRVVVHNSSTPFPLILSESFHSGWQVFQGNDEPSNSSDLNKIVGNYSAFLNNGDDQATEDDLGEYIKAGFISSLGDGKQKQLKSDVWNNGKETTENVGKYTVDFISKDIKGTIQNNNLKNGSIAETWLSKPVVSSSEHFVTNGYSNGWLIDTNKICQNNSQCRKNADGSYDLELVINFGPQRLYYLSLWVSLTVLIGSLGLALTIHFKHRTKK